MRKFRNLPGAALAVGAFVLTLMLGFGGAAASALWQQSATVAITVTWPAQAFTGFTCSNDSNRTNATLSAAATAKPASLVYAALQSNGSYGPSYSDSVTLGTTSTVVLNFNTPVIAANRNTAQLTIRVTATYADQTQSTATAVLQIEQGNNSNKVTCVSATL
ncbi:hypothetical protein GA0061083_0595 [Pseudarthrobacter enclensis]|uniref:Uncharacterized protein n=1 Tax=Pseudarthrobacter enclensis TaxID=993070 RepID=A0A0V8IVC7_9MICC|nr:hypothetical protein [Pseudarthrobacter enclensis]KSU78747.1 hypothetical protein AS031_01485 [Pseudarthrobacter enclensis]SCB76538.1 hypothetical protein GA0061083_0595 [Pseudarthrobacter enclensis]